MKGKVLTLTLCALMLLSLLAGCGNNADPTDKLTDAPTDPTIEAPTEESFDGKLIFDRSMELSYAKCFSLDYYKGGYKLASLSDGTRLLIVPEGMSIPQDAPEDAIVLRQPVENVLVSSAPVISLINAVGSLSSVSLTTNDVDTWYIDEVKDALTDGSLAYVGEFDAPDYEKIAASGCTLAIYSAMLTEDVEAQLESIGVNVMVDRSSEEEHPLARVEWAKFYAALFNSEDKAEEVFSAQESLVNGLSRLESTGKSVAVFYITSSGSLYARNAGDYMAKMVELAGGVYALSDVGAGKSGTAKMELEAFYEKASDADYIIYIWSTGGKPNSMEELLARGEILSELKAVKEGNVWCTTPDFFQLQSTIGGMVNDIHLMLVSDSSVDALTYLYRLK